MWYLSRFKATPPIKDTRLGQGIKKKTGLPVIFLSTLKYDGVVFFIYTIVDIIEDIIFLLGRFRCTPLFRGYRYPMRRGYRSRRLCFCI